MSDAAPVAKKNRWDWILWWEIDPAELERQVAEYDSLGFFHSMRGLSVLCLSLSVALTVTLIGFRALGLGASAFIDAAIMAILALFIYLGHRWASLAAMIIWTTEKVLIAVGGLGTTHVSGAMVISQLIWWAIYMHAFYFTFRIEQKRQH